MNFSPAVSFFIHFYSLSKSQIALIPRSGPKGNLLKGDIIDFVGPFQPIPHLYYSKNRVKLENLENFKIKSISLLSKSFPNLSHINVEKNNSHSRIKLKDTPGKYFTIKIGQDNLEYFYLKPNEVGVLSARVGTVNFNKNGGDLIDELSWLKVETAELDLIVNSNLIPRNQAQELFSRL